jgi:hypothetical protein
MKKGLNKFYVEILDVDYSKNPELIFTVQTVGEDDDPDDPNWEPDYVVDTFLSGEDLKKGKKIPFELEL